MRAVGVNVTLCGQLRPRRGSASRSASTPRHALSGVAPVAAVGTTVLWRPRRARSARHRPSVGCGLLAGRAIRRAEGRVSLSPALASVEQLVLHDSWPSLVERKPASRVRDDSPRERIGVDQNLVHIG